MLIYSLPKRSFEGTQRAKFNKKDDRIFPGVFPKSDTYGDGKQEISSCGLSFTQIKSYT